MQFPDDVTIVRAVESDAYGDPGSSWTNPQETAVRGFHVTPDKLLLPALTDVRMGDRVAIQGTLYKVQETLPARSPTSYKVVLATITRLEAQ